MHYFLDLDGTLTDLMGHLAKWHGLPYPDPWPAGEYDPQVAFGYKGSRSEFWRLLDGHEFWAALPWMPDGQAIVGMLEQMVGRDNITILTSPTLDPQCAAGKMMWVAKHLPQYRRKMFIGACKDAAAADTKVLIDDCDKNVINFRQAGGIGVLLPRPWNARHDMAHKSIDILRSHITALQKGIVLDMVGPLVGSPLACV